MSGPRDRSTGPLPTIADTLAQGVTRASVYCLADCRHVGTIELARLPAAMPFAAIATSRRLVCRRCRGRAVHVMPDWPLRPGMATPME